MSSDNRSQVKRSRPESPEEKPDVADKSRPLKRERDMDESPAIKKEPSVLPAVKTEPGAKLSLAEQKELLRQKKEALLKKKSVTTGEGAAAPPAEPAKPATTLLPSVAATVRGGPIPLLLDDQGRQIDEHGNIVSSVTHARNNKSLLINKRVEREKAFGSVAKKEDPEKLKGLFDPRIGAVKTSRPKKKTFKFIEPGSIVRKVERAEAEQRLDMLNEELRRNADGATPEVLLEAKLGVDAAKQEMDPIPEVEWWDLALPEDGAGTYEEIEKKALASVSNILEHPKEVKGFVPESKEVSMPLMLTKKEQKRLAREQRVAKEEETRAKITLGLIPPPPPKVRLSNMERVFGAKMAENPTAIEAEVRKAMQARLMKHLMDNEARKLTPEQRREKKIKAVIEDRKKELKAAVFRIDDMTNARLVWKVHTGAKETHCTGVLVTHKGMNVVVVEGGEKAIKFMKKLMLRRLDWNENKDDDDDDDNDEGGGSNSSMSNKCVLVWEGVILKPAFQRFDTIHTEGDVIGAKKVFEDAHVVQYWDLARSFQADEALVMNQKKDL